MSLVSELTMQPLPRVQAVVGERVCQGRRRGNVPPPPKRGNHAKVKTSRCKGAPPPPPPRRDSTTSCQSSHASSGKSGVASFATPSPPARKPVNKVDNITTPLPLTTVIESKDGEKNVRRSNIAGSCPDLFSQKPEECNVKSKCDGNKSGVKTCQPQSAHSVGSPKPRDEVKQPSSTDQEKHYKLSLSMSCPDNITGQEDEDEFTRVQEEMDWLKKYSTRGGGGGSRSQSACKPRPHARASPPTCPTNAPGSNHNRRRSKSFDHKRDGSPNNPQETSEDKSPSNEESAWLQEYSAVLPNLDEAAKNELQQALLDFKRSHNDILDMDVNKSPPAGCSMSCHDLLKGIAAVEENLQWLKEYSGSHAKASNGTKGQIAVACTESKSVQDAPRDAPKVRPRSRSSDSRKKRSKSTDEKSARSAGSSKSNKNSKPNSTGKDACKKAALASRFKTSRRGTDQTCQSSDTDGSKSVEVHTKPVKDTKDKEAPSQPQYDKYGRCKSHPSIIVAKKKPFGRGWSLVREEGCHQCKIEHEAKLTARQGSTCGHSSESSSSDGKGKKKAKPRPQGNSATVSKMPYKSPCGKLPGWYSGEVNDDGIPHGFGRMRYKNGQQFEGRWMNGQSEEYLENKRRMKRGFAENRSPWKESPCAPKNTNRHDAQPQAAPETVLHLSNMQPPGYFCPPNQPYYQPPPNQYGSFLSQQQAYNHF